MSSGCALSLASEAESCRPELCRTAYSSTFRDERLSLGVTGISSAACTHCAPSTGACPCLGEWAVRTVRWVILLERRYLPDTAKSHTRVVCWAGPQSVLSITGSPLCGAGWGRTQRRVQAQKWRWASGP